MKRPNVLVFANALSVVTLLLLASCAVQESPSPGSPPPGAPASMPAAKLGLAPQLRQFHDELLEHGDWVLVEPIGWVFRPRVNTVAWRPYQDGHWIPSYSYGWVWESNEPFGWITDHYGFWFFDEFQGWLWQPFGAWAPSWVAWVQVGDYVGWAPLPPDGAGAATDGGSEESRQAPGGTFTYVSTQALASGVSSTRAGFVRDIPDPSQSVHPIDRIASRAGVYWNAGPDPELVLGQANAEMLRMGEREGKVPIPEPPREFSRDLPTLRLPQLEQRTTRTWSAARRELLAERSRRSSAAPGGAAPSPAPAPSAPPPRFKSPEPPPADSAAADSLARMKSKAKPGTPRPPKP
jgi:hypothetical protein